MAAQQAQQPPQTQLPLQQVVAACSPPRRWGAHRAATCPLVHRVNLGRRQLMQPLGRALPVLVMPRWQGR